MKRLLLFAMSLVLVIGATGLVYAQPMAALPAQEARPPKTPLEATKAPALPVLPETVSGAPPQALALPAAPHPPVGGGGLLYLTSLDIGNATFAVYDPDADTWTTLNPYETGCQMAVSRLGTLYAYNYNTGTIDRYSPTTDSWSPALPAPPGSSGHYCNLEITNEGEFLYTQAGSTTLWYTAGLAWNTRPLPFSANVMGDYDPTADQYVVGEWLSTNAHRIDVHTWAITNYTSTVANGEYARFGVVMGNRYYFEAKGSNLHSFDLSSPASPPFDHGVSPGWYTSAAADRANGFIYTASLDATTLQRYNAATNSLSPRAGYGTSTWHSSLAFVRPLITWEKFVNGEPWYPGMTISAVPSQTITVEEVLHLLPEQPFAASAFTPVAVRGDEPTGDARPEIHSPARQIVAPQAPARPTGAVLWDQPLSTVNQAAYVNQEFPDFPTYSSFLADDFINAEPWSIATIFIPGSGWSGFTTLLNATALTWQIYQDCSGVPCGDPSGGGNPPVWGLTLAPTDPMVTFSTGTPSGLPSNVTLNLPVPLGLPAGHWWLVFYPTMSYGTYGQHGRQASDTNNGYTGQFINPGGAYGWGTAWQGWGVLGPTQHDIAFRLEGPPVFAQVEEWGPAHLTLVDWVATGGEVSVAPGSVQWTGELVASTVITLTKLFHVQPGPWTQMMLTESLWVDNALLEERLVTITCEFVYLPLIRR